MTLYFGIAGNSTVSTDTSLTYPTHCSNKVKVPEGSDLVPDSAVSQILDNGDGTVDAFVDVTNQGSEGIATDQGVQLTINGYLTAGALYDSAGAQVPVNTLPAGDKGYIRVRVPSNVIAECGQYSIVIDTNHKVQSGQPDPFGNDQRNMQTQCIMKWNAPITKARFGQDPPAWLADKSLSDIVNNRVSGRPDGALCSQCHFPGSGHPYSPPNTGNLQPATEVNGQTWGSGWGAVFAQQSIKPQPLKDAFTKWRDDGELP
jgi:hypothetical protein